MVLTTSESKLSCLSTITAAAKTKVFCTKLEIYDFKSVLLQQLGSLKK